MAGKSFEPILLGEGKLIIDEGDAGEFDAGYVRGGTFTDGYTVRHIQVDGKKGDVQGDAIVEEGKPMLEMNAVQMESAILEKVFSGLTVADAAGIKTITRSLTIATADYHINAAFVGKTKAGKDIKIIVKLALMEGPISLTFADKGEVEIPVVAIGNYTSIDDTDLPYEIVTDETV